MVWRTADDSSERRRIPKRVKLLAPVNSCSAAVPEGMAVRALLSKSGLIDISRSSVWRNPLWRAVRATLTGDAGTWWRSHSSLLSGEWPLIYFFFLILMKAIPLLQLKRNHNCWLILLKVPIFIFIFCKLWFVPWDISKQGRGNLRIVHISLLKTKYCSSFLFIWRKSRWSKDMACSYKSIEKKTKVWRLTNTSVQDGDTREIVVLCFSAFSEHILDSFSDFIGFFFFSRNL